jgi:hypothetical protein
LNDLKSRVHDTIDDGWPEQLEFLRALITQRSVLGNTNGAMEVTEPLLRELDMQVNRVPLDLDKLREQPWFSPPDWSRGGLPSSSNGHDWSGPRLDQERSDHPTREPRTTSDRWRKQW